MRQLLLISVVVGLLDSGSAGAQSGRRASLMIGIGARVRIGVADTARRPSLAWPAQRLQGTVRAIAPETLYLDLANVVGAVAIPREAIQGVAMSMGRPSRRESAMQLGTASAVLFALFMPSFVVQPERRFGSMERAAAASAGIGLGLGTLLGALRPYERWRTAWIPE